MSAGEGLHVGAGGIGRRGVARINGVLRARRAAVLVNGRLHLLEHKVDLLQVLFGAEVGHGREIVVLVVSTVGTNAEGMGRLGHELGG